MSKDETMIVGRIVLAPLKIELDLDQLKVYDATKAYTERDIETAKREAVEAERERILRELRQLPAWGDVSTSLSRMAIKSIVKGERRH